MSERLPMVCERCLRPATALFPTTRRSDAQALKEYVCFSCKRTVDQLSQAVR